MLLAGWRKARCEMHVAHIPQQTPSGLIPRFLLLWDASTMTRTPLPAAFPTRQAGCSRGGEPLRRGAPARKVGTGAAAAGPACRA